MKGARCKRRRTPTPPPLSSCAVRTHAHMQTCTCSHAHTRTHTRAHAHPCTHAHTCTPWREGAPSTGQGSRVLGPLQTPIHHRVLEKHLRDWATAEGSSLGGRAAHRRTKQQQFTHVTVHKGTRGQGGTALCSPSLLCCFCGGYPTQKPQQEASKAPTHPSMMHHEATHPRLTAMAKGLPTVVKSSTLSILASGLSSEPATILPAGQGRAGQQDSPRVSVFTPPPKWKVAEK
jgi:hypothetical protein